MEVKRVDFQKNADGHHHFAVITSRKHGNKNAIRGINTKQSKDVKSILFDRRVVLHIGLRDPCVNDHLEEIHGLHR